MLPDILVGAGREAQKWLFWLPRWAVGSLLLIAVAALALIVHAALLIALDRLLRPYTFARQLVARTRGPSAVALVLFALGFAVPALPLTTDLASAALHLIVAGVIVDIGWSALLAAQLFVERYLRRLRTDIDDNLLARKHITQVRILARASYSLIVVVTIGAALMTFDAVRQYGVSLFASAGAAGLIVGLAARPVLSNLIAGIQIAITQPIRVEDAVVVQGEWGWIEDIGSTYVVIRIWDWRRLIVPLAYFIEQPFQNWTHQSADLIGHLFLYVDYTVPVEPVRDKLMEIVRASKRWDGKVVNLQVTDALHHAVQLRVLVSAKDSPTTWDLRCEVREKLVDFLQREYPGCLPRQRAELVGAASPAVSELAHTGRAP